MTEKITSAERVRRLQTATENLSAVLAIVEAEVKAIAQVHKRFSARKPQPRTANATK
jgi:hypothetical protein